MTTKRTIKIVIVEDDRFFNKSLEKYIETVCNSKAYADFDFEIKTYLNAQDCIKTLDKDTEIMFLDYYLINMKEREMMNGADVLQRVKELCTDCKVIMVSNLKNIQMAVELMRRGVYEFVNKNKNSFDRIGEVLQRLLSKELHVLKS